ncbi:kinase-like domain-containing protein [Gilbertella persicaria]|uniref:kinase-like domain-containing protein n=1 Tax=Gilbertella persicaria TaxID=101096 RepID=UPI00221FBA92|nr:kinase-like domain-containing protein [Gilbertella persicaria]KAI8056288.1 kinase-like domain-containing protein [Gilbertella persicaria]
MKSFKPNKSHSNPNFRCSAKVVEKLTRSPSKHMKRRTAGFALSPLAGLSPRRTDRLAQPAKSSAMIRKKADGFCEIIETKRAWGYLVQGRGHVFTLDKGLHNRQESEAAGYVIGTGNDCDIVIHHVNAEKRHAFIFFETRFDHDKHSTPVFICNHSTNGTWINGEKVKGFRELETNDIIQFLDPSRYPLEENPCYIFVESTMNDIRAKSIDSFYNLKSNIIGKGNYGNVVIAECKETGKTVAIKMIPRKAFAKREVWKTATLREISVCMLFPIHPCIIQVSRMFEQDQQMYIVMEYGPHGDLFDIVACRDEIFKEYEVRIIFDQIAHAVACLHENDIVHRDIKLENVIVTDKKNLYVKLCDFGFSTFINQKQALTTSCGTAMYVAPEIVSARPYGKAVDVWSLGVLLFITLTSTSPFPQLSDDQTKWEKEKAILDKSIKEGKFTFSHPSWEYISAEAKDLIQQMMKVNVEERINIEQVLQHPWLQQIENAETFKTGLKRNPMLVKYLERK